MLSFIFHLTRPLFGISYLHWIIATLLAIPSRVPSLFLSYIAEEFVSMVWYCAIPMTKTNTYDITDSLDSCMLLADIIIFFVPNRGRPSYRKMGKLDLANSHGTKKILVPFSGPITPMGLS